MSDAHNTRSGRVEQPDALAQAKGGKTFEFAQDSIRQNSGLGKPLSSKKPYLTRAKASAIGLSLGHRERALLEDVSRLGVASGGQLSRLRYEASEAGRRLARIDLARLCDCEVLARLDRSVGGVRAGSKSHSFVVGLAGQRILYPHRPRFRQPWTPSLGNLNHALARSELFVQLKTRIGDQLVAFDSEPLCWRRYFGPGGAPAILKPDAFTILDLGRWEDRAWVEIDLASESGARIVDKARAYIRYWRSGREIEASGVFPQVVFVTTTEVRRDFMVAALRRLPPEHWQLFAVVTAAEAAEQMAKGTIQSISNREEER
jgi:Replication-relaxation